MTDLIIYNKTSALFNLLLYYLSKVSGVCDFNTNVESQGNFTSCGLPSL